MRLILLLSILLSAVACVGTGKRTPIPFTTAQDGLKVEERDMPKMSTSTSALLITREAGDFDLSSLYLSEYLKTKKLPAFQFFNNDEVVGEIAPVDQARFLLIADAKDINVTDGQIAEGEDHGNSIASSQLKGGQVWVVEKTTESATYTIIFKITDYRAGKSLKISYKVKEFKYL
jgi:hypothetical protein